MIAFTYKTTRFFAPVMALLMLLAPMAGRASAQDFDDGKPKAAATTTTGNASYVDARSDAARDAETDISAGGWFAAGFLCGVFGWLFAYLSDSKPPVSRLMGKDSDYVLAYSSEYESKAKGIKTSKSLIGCLVGSVVSILIQVIVVSSSGSSSN